MRHDFTHYTPVEQRPWRKPRPTEELVPLPSKLGKIHGRWRCRAIFLGGLRWKNCVGIRLQGSFYCSYHDRLQKGLMEPQAESYPVWPLPKTGFVLTDTEDHQYTTTTRSRQAKEAA